MRTKDEVETMLNVVDDQGESKYPAMTYEQGVAEALRWVLGELDDDEFESSLVK